MGRNRDFKFCMVACAVLFGGLYTNLSILSYFEGRNRLARTELNKIEAEKGYILQERDLNKNGIAEKFYEIDGKMYFLSIDGKDVSDLVNNGFD